MKRSARARFGVLLVLPALLVASLAAPLAAAAATSHYKQTGPGASAIWSTCPDGPVPGVECTETNVIAGAVKIRTDGSTWADRYLVFERHTFVCDDAGECRSIAHTVGFAGPSDVELTLHGRRLAGMTVSGSALAVTCAPDGDEVVCGEWEWSTVDVTWTADGDARNRAFTDRYSTRCFTEVFHVHGAIRPALATGAIDGQDLGASVFGRVSDGTLVTQTVTRTC